MPGPDTDTDTGPAPPTRPPLTAWLYLALCAVGFAEAFRHPPAVAAVSVVLAALYLGLELRRTQRVHLALGYLLVAGGLAFGVAAGKPVEVLLGGVTNSLKFLLLFFAVTWLQAPAKASPTLIAVRQAVLDQPQGRRFFILGFAAHVLGAFLNLAGLTLLSDMVLRPKQRRNRERLAIALMVGFTSASAWSPFYVSVTVVLAAMPQVAYRDVVLPGMAMGLCVVAVTALLDRFLVRGAKPPPPPGPRLSAVTWRNFVVIVALLFAFVLSLETGLGLPIPVILAIVAPPFAAAWTAVIRRPGGVGGLSREVFHQLPSLRGESLIFVGANMFGTGLATVLDPTQLAALLHLATWPDAAKLIGLSWFMIAAGAVGLHPVILVILVGTVLPPEVFGLPPLIMALTLLGTWGLSTTSSPFSGTTLVVARLTGESGYRLAWRAAPLYSLTGALVVSLVALALWKLGLYFPGP